MDGVSTEEEMAHNFSLKYKQSLNRKEAVSEGVRQLLINSLPSDISNIEISKKLCFSAISSLRSNKSDGSSLFFSHLLAASSVLVAPLAKLFTAIIRDSYPPPALWGFTLPPISM